MNEEEEAKLRARVRAAEPTLEERAVEIEEFFAVLKRACDRRRKRRY